MTDWIMQLKHINAGPRHVFQKVVILLRGWFDSTDPDLVIFFLCHSKTYKI